MDELDNPRIKGAHALGEPALLLVESLIHELVARAALDRDIAIGVIETALEAQIALCDDRGEDVSTSAAVSALSRIQSSLVIDSGGTAAAGVDRRARNVSESGT